MGSSRLEQIVHAQHQGDLDGITSVCSANPTVIEATLRHALITGETVLVESTCNQVNQFGGYTGMTPADFMVFMNELTAKVGFPHERLLIGGDHLGPSVWQEEPAAAAMEKAGVLVQRTALAGYDKIHLDASMRCADDPAHQPLDPRTSANRAADLAQIAEEAYGRGDSGIVPPCYVIGTEVPPPGGIQDEEEVLRVTSPAEVEETIAHSRQAFAARGLEAAWERVIAVVVQPGVEYGNQTIYDYQRHKALPLSQFIEGVDGLVFEAHSTDYQTKEALRQLVEDHFAILKVGPALTFAYREAVFALAMIENELFHSHAAVQLSGIREALDLAMLDNPQYWRKYYAGPSEDEAFARKYSLSDRSRYYWPLPDVQVAVEQLMFNLKEAIPLPLISQYLPRQYHRVRAGSLKPDPKSLIRDSIYDVLADYSYACQGE